MLEEQLQGYAGRLKVQVAGPWTLAATVEKPRGDKLLSDLGARRELAQALAEGVRVHLADVQRRVPGAELLLQVDEPALPFVLGGQVPTASGFSRHRSVKPPEAQDALEWVLAAAGESATVVHCCASEVPIALLRRSGAGGVSVDLSALVAGAYEELATAIDEGAQVHLGVVRSTGDTRAAAPRSPWSACSGSSTCSGSTPRRCPASWCSRRRAGWPARARRTPRVCCARCARRRPSSAEPA